MDFFVMILLISREEEKMQTFVKSYELISTAAEKKDR